MRSGAVAAVVASLLLGAAGCAGNAAVEATTVLAYHQCQGLSAGLTRVDYATVASLRGGTLLRMTEPEAPARPPDAEAHGAVEPGADEPGAEEEPLLVAISRGAQPTPGYRLTLDGAHRHDRTVVVSVHWQEPDPDAVLAQTITHPCLVVALPRADFTRVEAVDQAGEALGGLDLQPVRAPSAGSSGRLSE